MLLSTLLSKRDEFNRMIDECHAGNIDMIITKSISRFARNTLDCLKFIRELKDIATSKDRYRSTTTASSDTPRMPTVT